MVDGDKAALGGLRRMRLFFLVLGHFERELVVGSLDGVCRGKLLQLVHGGVGAVVVHVYAAAV